MSINLPFIYCIIFAWWWPLWLKHIAICKSRFCFCNKKIVVLTELFDTLSYKNTIGCHLFKCSKPFSWQLLLMDFARNVLQKGYLKLYYVWVYFSYIIWYSFRWGRAHMFTSLAGGVMVFIAVCLWTTVQQDRVWRETSCCYTSILYYTKQLSFFGHEFCVSSK